MSPLQVGFIDPSAASAAVRRLKLRRALREAEALVATLLDGLDEPRYSLRNAVALYGVELAQGDAAGSITGDAIQPIKCDDSREKQLLEGADLFLQFLNSLLKARSHGLFSTNHSDALDATAVARASHRLSEGRSRT